MKYLAAPNDSRYIPFTQQAECCVPTSILMLMYRNQIPLIPAEELGHHLGLVVPPHESDLFYNARSSNEPPSAAGYGTQIFEPEYEPNKIFNEIGIPLSFEYISIEEISNFEVLLTKLQEIENEDSDALLCFNHGVIRGEFQPLTGHVVVFDKIINGQIRIVDASSNHPKWRTVKAGLMFEAMKLHGVNNAGGIWKFKKIM